MAPGRTALVALAVSSAFVLGQQTTSETQEVRIRSADYAPPPPTIQVESNLVELAVTVRDSSGKALGGFTAADFEILDAGEPKPIHFFSEQRSHSTASKTTTSPSSDAATSNSATNTVPRSIALFFDDTHTDVAGLHLATVAAEKLVTEELAPGDRVAVFTDSGAVTLDFTSDSAALLAALRKLRPHVNHNAGNPLCPRMTPFEAYVITRNLDYAIRKGAVDEAVACNCAPPVTQVCISAQEGLVEDLAKSTWDANKSESTVALDVIGIALRRLAVQQGSRTLILVSQGFISGEMDQQMSGLVDTAIRARIVMNAIDPAGLDPYLSGLRQQVLSEFMSTASASTGGRYFHNNNDIMGGLRTLADSPDTSYLLGFSPDGEGDGKFHPLKVRLKNQHGLRVEARAGYYASPAAGQQLTAQQRIDHAMLSQEKGTPVPVSIGVRPSRTKAGAHGLTVVFNIDANRLKFKKERQRLAQQLTFAAALEDSSGAYLTGKQATMDLFLTPATLARFRSNGLHTTLSFVAPPGTYRMRAVVRDAVEDHIGSATIPFVLR